MPWSPGASSDDKILSSVDHFRGLEVVITEKMDGENTTMYNDHIHARSLDSVHHSSRAWVKWLWSTINYQIPNGVRICGENLYAKHSIYYRALSSYFMAFSVWCEDVCLDWDETIDFLDSISIVSVPVLYRGSFDDAPFAALDKNIVDGESEGYVVRLAGSFTMNDFNKSVAKYVRKDHVQTDQHWMHQEIVPNGLVD